MGGQGFPFWVLELGSGLISNCNKEMTLDTKSCWVDHAGSFPGKEGNGTRNRQREAPRYLPSIELAVGKPGYYYIQ